MTKWTSVHRKLPHKDGKYLCIYAKKRIENKALFLCDREYEQQVLRFHFESSTWIDPLGNDLTNDVFAWKKLDKVKEFNL